MECVSSLMAMRSLFAGSRLNKIDGIRREREKCRRLRLGYHALGGAFFVWEQWESYNGEPFDAAQGGQARRLNRR